jgi:hypothetical protein
MFSLVTGYKIMNYQRYCLGLCYLKYLKQQVMFACWDHVCSALEGGGWSAPRPSRFTPGTDPVPIVQEAGWAPGPVWTWAKNLAPTGIRSPDRPARSQSLYRLSYPAHPPYSAITYMNTIRLHLCRIYTKVPIPPDKAWKKNVTLVQPFEIYRCYFCNEDNFVWSSCFRTLMCHSIHIKEFNTLRTGIFSSILITNH